MLELSLSGTFAPRSERPIVETKRPKRNLKACCTFLSTKNTKKGVWKNATHSMGKGRGVGFPTARLVTERRLLLAEF